MLTLKPMVFQRQDRRDPQAGGTTTIDQSNFSANSSCGAGIYIYSGLMTITNSAIVANNTQGTSTGGGIQVKLDHCTVSNNRSYYALKLGCFTGFSG